MDYEKSYKNVSWVHSIFLFFFARKKFIEKSVIHDTGLIITVEPDLRKKYESGEYLPDESDLRSNATTRTINLRKSFLLSGFFVFVAILAAFLSGLLLRKYICLPPNIVIKSLQVIGAALILWPTLWEVGWNIKSFGGHTLPERVHKWIIRSLYSVGTYCLFLSVIW